MNAESKNNTIPKAYSGGGNYVVISYCHDDTEEVVSDIEQLDSQGIHVWYDEGLVYGKKWNEQVLSLIAADKCIGVVFYVSEEYMARETFWREAKMTGDHNKPFCVVMLDSQPNPTHSSDINANTLYQQSQ